MKHKTVLRLTLASILLFMTALAVEAQLTENKPKPPMQKGKFSPNVGFPIKELAPNAQFKIKFSSGSTRVVSGALDIKNKINESDEKNNSVKF